MEQVSANSLANFQRQALGVPQVLNTNIQCTYSTSSGDSLYEKILVGYKPVLFPTACSENCCFEYRFTIKDLILPKSLPQITGLYFKDIVIKLQDMFTQAIAGDAISNGKILTYMPYCMILSQDENGIELEDYMLGDKKVKVISSDRMVQRESCPVFSVNSNLKMEKSISLQDMSNPYKIIGIFEQYDEEGNFVRRVMENIKCVSPENLVDIINENASIVEKRKGRLVCIDVILCDLLVFCKRTFDFNTKPITEVETLSKTKKQTLPIGWMKPEEKMQKLLDIQKGRKAGETEKLPNDLFYFVDMTERSAQLLDNSKPVDMVFEDSKKLIAPFVNQYAYSIQIINTRTYDK